MDKLDTHHLTPYLPYGVNFLTVFDKQTPKLLTGICGNIIYYEDHEKWIAIDAIKPILRPLSEYFDITSPAMKELNLSISDQIALANIASGIYHTSELPYRLICRLAEEYIDFMGLITAGLAVSYREAAI